MIEFDPAQDGSNNPASGSMKVTFGFDAAALDPAGTVHFIARQRDAFVAGLAERCGITGERGVLAHGNRAGARVRRAGRAGAARAAAARQGQGGAERQSR